MKVERLGKRETPFGLLGYKELKAKLDETAKTAEAIVREPWVFVKVFWPDHRQKSGQYEDSAGFTRCMYTDTFDEKRGIAIARGRAVADYAKRLWDNGTKRRLLWGCCQRRANDNQGYEGRKQADSVGAEGGGD